MTKSVLTQPRVRHELCCGRHPTLNKGSWRYTLIACAVLLGLAACAQAPKKEVKKEAPPLVFPLPPDDARFYYERTIRSSSDVDKSIVDTTLQDLLTGSSSASTNVPFRKPYAVAVHQGRIFVSEPSSRMVKVYDVPQGKFFTIGREDPGTLAMPIGLDVDGAGNLYVADITAAAVMVYDRDGNFLRKLAGAKIGEPPTFKRLTSIAVDMKGERIYCVDIGGIVGGVFGGTVEDHRVRVFDIKTNTHLFDIGKRGNGPGEFNLPRDAVLDKDNNLYVVDGANFRVQVFDAEGKFLREFGKLGQQLGDFSRPKEIASDPAGNIYVVDAGFNNIQIFTPDGQLLMPIGTGGSTEEEDMPARYRLISGIDVDEDGRMYVVDQMYKKVDIFRPAAIGTDQGYLGRKWVKNGGADLKVPADKKIIEPTPLIDKPAGTIPASEGS